MAWQYYLAVFIYCISLLSHQLEAYKSILDKYYQENIDEVSCQNWCGNDTPVCSCRNICLIYQNCCEDFEEKCPKEFNHTDKIKHLIGASVLCQRNYFMVNGCPQYRNISGDWYEDERNSRNADTISRTNGQSFFQEIMSRRPVTDSRTGVTFYNWHYFRCSSDVDSEPVQWDVRWIAHSGQTFHDSTDFMKIIFNNEPHHYQPPLLNTAVNGDPCAVDLVDQCQSSSQYYDPVLDQECRSFLSIVSTYTRGKTIYYKNIYCALCSEDLTANNYKLTYINEFESERGNELSIQMSMNGNGLALTSFDRMNTFSWSRGFCSYQSDLTVSSGTELQCGSFVCKRKWVKTPDGMCKQKVKIRVAIMDDNYPMTLEELDHLPFLVSCIFHELSDGETITDTNQKGVRLPFHFYSKNDNNDNIALYTVENNIFWYRDSLYRRDDPLYRLVDIAAKAIDTNRVRHRNIFDKNNVNKPTNNALREVGEATEAKSSDSTRLLLTTTTFEHDLTWSSELTIVNQSSIITACFCLQIRGVKDACELHCWNSPRFQEDLKEIEMLLASPCFNSSGSFYLTGANLLQNFVVLLTFSRKILAILLT